MPIYKIISSGNNIIADAEFVETHHAGDYELQPEAPMASVAPALSARDRAKQARAIAVAAIKVTTAAGNTFDGDETSINRITAAITVLKAVGGTVPWVMADNSIVVVGEAELTEALALAAAEVARLWVVPYEVQP